MMTFISNIVFLCIGLGAGIVLGVAAEQAKRGTLADVIRSGAVDGEIERAIQRNNQRKGQAIK